MKLGLGMVENILEKEKMLGYPHFLLFPQSFQKPSVSGLWIGSVW